ncbi:hypothetical protein Nepgr_001095 [Nepenthes gracilis]|uniref:Hyccin n=1 Tax=Nepenthes gracilis TaxID=150966 RepID=A0AAD3RX38_NEPGR|nr:hypothetical protein Nepgr_001095 [Nepenthes gracilis]
MEDHQQLNHQSHAGVSLFNSSSDHTNNSSSSVSTAHNHRNHTHNHDDPMHSWWESVSKARSRIHSLVSLLPHHDDSSISLALSSLADSDCPARSLLESSEAYCAISASLSSPLSGSGDDPLCQWLYDTFQSSVPDLRLVVLSFVPLVAGLYLSRVHSFTIDASAPSLAGFEVVLLALYASETKSRAGKPLLISIPDLSQPSLYHTPRQGAKSSLPNPSTAVGVLSPPLEPHLAVKSTKRSCIVGVALDSFYKHISQMPSWSKIELCQFTAAWAGENCACAHSLDPSQDDDDIVPFFLENNCDRVSYAGQHEIKNVAEEMARLEINEKPLNSDDKGARIPLPWEILQPVLRILAHCLLAPLNSQVIRDAAAVAVRRLYARASHDLFPQAILATRSLIQIDNRGRAAARAASIAAASSNTNTPTKAKKPEILLVSK